jgi:hypothetical protein
MGRTNIGKTNMGRTNIGKTNMGRTNIGCPRSLAFGDRGFELDRPACLGQRVINQVAVNPP